MDTEKKNKLHLSELFLLFLVVFLLSYPSTAHFKSFNFCNLQNKRVMLSAVSHRRRVTRGGVNFDMFKKHRICNMLHKS